MVLGRRDISVPSYPMTFPTIHWDSRALAKVDQASFAWRNARDRGNNRRKRYWSYQMWYWAARATGMTPTQARAAAAEDLLTDAHQT